MAAIGVILKNGLDLSRRIQPLQKRDPYKIQERVLHKLLRKAEFTFFGQEYDFTDILFSRDMVTAFQENVPVYTYETIFRKWWNQTLAGESSVCWPGKVEFFALSSGTSSGSSKYIPVTRSMLRAIQKGSVRQIMSLAHCELPQSFFEKDIMMLGGSTNLDFNGIFYAGDLSGITTGNLPFWFQPFYKPGREISRTRNWQEKLDRITKEAHQWDVGAIVGVPSWFQILMERIIEYHNVKTIHDVWPNLMVFTHGGVAFEPYKKSFESLLGRPLIYLETYLASEGFIAYQANPRAEGMRMHIRNGIFYEFVPFNEENFDLEGNIKPNAQALTIRDAKENVDYALLLSTCAGAWRYIIGDTIRFTDVKNYEIKITGRTKHFLSLCGEHLSVDNMNRAIELVSEELNIGVKEFTVAGAQHQSLFAHHWFISAENEADTEVLARRLDANLKELNDDYATERLHALKEVFVEVIPNEMFLGWLKSKGQEGAQIKFPRVVKGDTLRSWIAWLKDHGYAKNYNSL